MAALFGVHLGNTSACIAFCKDEERIEIIANDAGDRLTQTTVQWSPSQCLVGKSAVLEQFRCQTSTVYRCKQLLNENISDEELDALRKQVPFRINKTGTVLKYELILEGKQNQVAIKEILLSIFKKLHAIAATSGKSGVSLEAVIGVPSYFPPQSVQIVKDVANKAGFKVLQVADEASLALLAVLPPEKSGLCIVCRVGGFSLDVTLFNVQDGMYTILSECHKSGCGGKFITEKLRDFLISEFKRQYKGQDVTDRGKFKLEAVADTAKQILTKQNVAQCSAESVGGGFDLNCSVSRPRLDNIVAEFLPILSDAIQQTVRQANLTADQIEMAVICGGTTKIPRVQELIKNLLPSAELFGSASPDEWIAIGAAKQARLCSKLNVEEPSNLCMDVPTTSSGISLKVSNSDNQEIINHQVPADTLLPTAGSLALPENCSSLELAVNGDTVRTVPLTASTNMDYQIDKNGVLTINLPPIDVNC